jgi:hypothetical protein
MQIKAGRRGEGASEALVVIVKAAKMGLDAHQGIASRTGAARLASGAASPDALVGR